MNAARRIAVLVAGAVLAVLGVPAGAQSPGGKLVLYTSQPERDAAQTVAAFRKVHPAVEVEVFRSGTTEVMAKLAAELAGVRPKVDVLLIADAASMMTPRRKSATSGGQAGVRFP